MLRKWLPICLLASAAMLHAAHSGPSRLKTAQRRPITVPSASAAGISGRLGTRISRFHLNPGNSSHYKAPASLQTVSIGQAVRQSARIWRDETTGLPFFVTHTVPVRMDTGPGPAAKAGTQAQALRYLDWLQPVLGMPVSSASFRLSGTITDINGNIHQRFQQIHGDLEIWGKDIVVHTTGDQRILGFNGRYVPPPAITPDRTRVLPAALAVSAARSHWGLNQNDVRVDRCEEKIYIDPEGTAHHVWHVVLIHGPERRFYFMDAMTGSLIHWIDYTMTGQITTGTGTDLLGIQRTVPCYEDNGLYTMMDLTKPMYDAASSTPVQPVYGGLVVLDIVNQDDDPDAPRYYVESLDKNNWPANAVSMIWAMDRIYDYYLTIHGRNSIDGQGMTMYSIINLGQDYNNAYWNGHYIHFGNGDGFRYSDLCGAVDVIAHEITHGVTQHTSNLIYENQSGALNEAMSDIFGACAEIWIDGGPDDWLMGEDAYTPAVSGDAMRDMEDPASSRVTNKLPTHMDEYQYLPNTQDGDWGGVHVNMSIITRAFVMIAKSIGRQKAEQVFYKAQTDYLTRSSRFVDCRLAAAQSARDLYGDNEAGAVETAFDAVGVGQGQATPPPPDLPPVTGDEWVLVTGISDHLIYKCSPDGNQILPFSQYTSICRPTVTDNGSTIFFIDENNDLIGIYSDGTGEENLTQGSDIEGLIGSIAISPDNHWVAYTSIYADAMLYIDDMIGDDHKAYQLYSPVTWQTDPAYDVSYADALDWTLDSEYLLFDCLCVTPMAGMDNIEYWSIKMMRISDGQIYNVFGSLPPGVHVGNPVFASNSDYIFAYDYMDSDGNTAILAGNLETGDEGFIIDDNMGLIGRPCYNPRDNVMAFHTSVLDPDTWISVEGIAQVQLNSDKITGVAGTETGYLTWADYPVWFVIGERSDVETDPAAPLPAAMRLYQNHPNPFNPVTRITFDISEPGPVRLAVYDVTGREVACPVDEVMQPGVYHADLDGRSLPAGLYVYTLEAGDARQSRKCLLIK